MTTVEVPFIKVGNRRCLTAEQLKDDPHLSDFVKRFEHCFEYDVYRCIHLFIEKANGNRGE